MATSFETYSHFAWRTRGVKTVAMCSGSRLGWFAEDIRVRRTIFLAFRKTYAQTLHFVATIVSGVHTLCSRLNSKSLAGATAKVGNYSVCLEWNPFRNHGKLLVLCESTKSI